MAVTAVLNTRCTGAHVLLKDKIVISDAFNSQLMHSALRRQWTNANGETTWMFALRFFVTFAPTPRVPYGSYVHASAETHVGSPSTPIPCTPLHTRVYSGNSHPGYTKSVRRLHFHVSFFLFVVFQPPFSKLYHTKHL